jgi:hypothetical protein
MSLSAPDAGQTADDRRALALLKAGTDSSLKHESGAMKVLSDLSRSMQVVFLTYHDHLVPLAREVLDGDLNVVSL